MKNNQDKYLNQRSYNWIYWLILIIAILIPLFLYFNNFGSTGYSATTSDWGIFGDYIGGTIGTLLALLSVVLIYITYRNQFASTTKQQFENTYFHLLSIYKETISNFANESTYPYQKKAAYSIYDEKGIDNRVPAEYEYVQSKNSGHNNIYNINKNISDVSIKNPESLQEILDKKFEENDLKLPQMLNMITQILLAIENCKYINKSNYVDILRALMTESELSLVKYFQNYPKVDSRLGILNAKLELVK